jgi:hypothetical protein
MRTRLYADAQSDLLYLEAIAQNRQQGVLFGYVHRRITDAEGKPALTFVPEALSVVASGAGQRRTAVTDQAGVFLLPLPPGDFEVWVERGGSVVSPKSPVRVEDRYMHGLSLTVQFEGL